MNKVIVTGGSGFIGSNLVDKLNRSGHEVVVIDNFITGDPGNLPHIFGKISLIDINEWELDKLTELCDGAKCIFHMAAFPSVQKSIECPLISSQDLSATVKMLEVATRIKVNKFVFSSSCSVYGEPPTSRPLSPYALSKLHGEDYCAMYSSLHGLDTVCLRYYNVYGPRMSNVGAYRSVLSVFLEAYKAGKPLNIVNDGEQKREFVHVDDVVDANLCAMNAKRSSSQNIFDISYGRKYSVNEIADMFGGNKVYGETRIEPKEIKKSNIESAKCFLAWEPRVKLEDWIPL